MTDEATKDLILHIKIPGIWADDLDNLLLTFIEGEKRKSTPEDMSDMLTLEMMRAEVGITIVTLPGLKNANDDFLVLAYEGLIVGAEVWERR